MQAPGGWTAGSRGWALLLAGWLLPQAVLLGPALIGRTVNLPVDLLATPHLYLPANAQYRAIVPYHRLYLLDLLLGFPDSREFSIQEMRAGRVPTLAAVEFCRRALCKLAQVLPLRAAVLRLSQPRDARLGQSLASTCLRLGNVVVSEACPFFIVLAVHRRRLVRTVGRVHVDLAGLSSASAGVLVALAVAPGVAAL